MRFSCDQRWEDMAPAGNDRFCLSCQKPVVDFTGWERDALVAWFRERPDTCGMFRAEQVDPSLIAMKEVDLGVRKGIFAALAALTLTTAQAQGERSSPALMEQTDSGAPGRQVERQPNELNGERCWVEKETVTADKPQKRSSGRHKLYVSKRFPFIHLKRRRTMGRIQMGCPSF